MRSDMLFVTSTCLNLTK